MTSKMNLPSNPMALITTTVLNKSLSSMVKGIRGHRDAGELQYINQCISEIKEELKTNFPEVKAQALQKLIYLHMIGFDCSFANFHVVEVMSSSWFGHKRMGYLAASLLFDQSTDVILLTTHLFRKGFSGNVQTGLAAAEGVQFEQGAAISCLAAIATPDLAMDLLNDVFVLMNSSRPYIRKKAVLVLLRLFRVWPKALRLSFDRLREKLEDENAGVVSAAVYVICELAAKNPKNYLSLAPVLFKLLTSSSNNWVLIKVVKLLGLLSPVEPRLAKKLLDPLTDLITTTPAKSLLYECINCMLSGELRSKSAIRLCLDKLRGFIEDPDQNLKYLGLLGLHKLMLKHPRVVSEHKDLMLACLNDEDVTIRMRALDLIVAMVNPKNLNGILRKLQDHLSVSEGAYREHVLGLMLQIGSADNYGCVRDFESYVGLLLELSALSGVSLQNARELASQLSDVCIRVPGVRAYAVSACKSCLIDQRWIEYSQENKNMSEVLQAVGFLVGEFSEYVTDHDRLIAQMLAPQLKQCTQQTQATFIHSAIKVFASALNQPFDEASKQSNQPEITKPVKDLLGRRDLDDADENQLENGDNDEIIEAPSTSQSSNQPLASPTDADPETEEEELDENGVKKRKVRAVPRRYNEWLRWIGSMLDRLIESLPIFTRSDSIEVQERAVTYLAYLNWFIQEGGFDSFMKKASSQSVNQPTNGSIDLLDLDVTSSLTSSLSNSPTNNQSDDQATLPDRSHILNLSIQTNLLFSERLNPVNPKAQRKVPVPKGLSLDQAINPGWDKDSEDEEFSATSESDDERSSKQSSKHSSKQSSKRSHRRDRDNKKSSKKKQQYSDESDEYTKPMSAEEKAAAKQRLDARKQAQQNDPFYIKPSTSSPTNQSTNQSAPVDLLSGEPVRDRKKHRSDKEKEKDKKSDKPKPRDDDDLFAGVDTMKSSHTSNKTYKVKQTADMPSDAAESEEEDKKVNEKEKDKKKKRDHDDKEKKRDRDDKDKKRDRDDKDKKRDRDDKDKKRDRDDKEKKRDRDGDKDKKRDRDDKEKDKKRDRDDKEKDKKRDRSDRSSRADDKSSSRHRNDDAEQPKQGLDLFDPFAASPAKKKERSSRH